jgi:hypothetical protein
MAITIVPLGIFYTPPASLLRNKRNIAFVFQGGHNT